MAYYKKGGSFNKEKGSQTDIYTEINNKILEMIQGNKIPWRQTWEELKGKELKSLSSFNQYIKDLPYNPVTKTVYRGVNHLMLKYIDPNFAQTGDPRFLTFNNIQEGKYSLKKGSKATYVFFAKRIVPNSKTDSSSDSSDDPGKPGYSILKKYPVFHASSIENYPSYAEVREQQLSELQRKTEEMMKNRPELFQENVFLENIIKNGNVKIEEIPNQNPCYIPSKDKILMPPVLQWESKNEFNGTLLHELSHWSGHESRLNRDLKNKFGSKEYAFEELVAELSKTYTCSQIDIDPNFNQGAAYIQSWITLLEDNPKAFFQAASKAQEASDYLLDLGYPKELTKELDEIKKSQIENSIEIGDEKAKVKTPIISTEEKTSISVSQENPQLNEQNLPLTTILFFDKNENASPYQEIKFRADGDYRDIFDAISNEFNKPKLNGEKKVNNNQWAEISIEHQEKNIKATPLFKVIQLTDKMVEIVELTKGFKPIDSLSEAERWKWVVTNPKDFSDIIPKNGNIPSNESNEKKHYSSQLDKFIESNHYANSGYKKTDGRTWVSYYQDKKGLIHSSSFNYSIIPGGNPVTVEEFKRLIERNPEANVTLKEQSMDAPNQTKIFDTPPSSVKMENVYFTGIKKELGGGTMVYADIAQSNGIIEKRTVKLSKEEVSSLPNLSHVEKIKLAEKLLVTNYEKTKEVSQPQSKSNNSINL